MSERREPFRVLVVDDSAYLRKVLSHMLGENPMLRVVGTARDGRDALDKIEELNPEVVTLDLHMPEMNGVEFLRTQLARRWLPVVVVSSEDLDGNLMVEALAAGAVDFVHKPTALANEKLYSMSRELIDCVLTAGVASASAAQAVRPAVPMVWRDGQHAAAVDAVVIGTSTGGPQALRFLIPTLPAEFPVPLAVVVHMPGGYTQSFASKLNELSPLEVCEAETGLEMRRGRVIIAQGGRHLYLRRHDNGIVSVELPLEPLDTMHRPAVDVMFKSAADAYGGRLLGLVLTGMGSDGSEGAAWIKAAGGQVWTQAEPSCIVYGMPRSVVEAGLSDRAVELDDLPLTLLELF